MRITSTSNTHIKRIRALRSRKERALTGLFFAEGLRVVREAMSAPGAVELLIVAPELLAGAAAWETVATQRAGGGRVLEVSAEVFASLSERDGPQGIAAVVRQRWSELPQASPGESPWVALYGVKHPGNLGAVLRTCDAVGARGVILIGATTDPHDPASVRASMGTIVHQQLVRCSDGEFVAWSRADDRTLVGTSGAAERDYREAVYPRGLVLLMGAERRGLPRELLAACQEIVRIPMVGRADSLNLAVATGLVLYESVRGMCLPVRPQRGGA
jgi:RNA methyltransferase, TrmH family